MIGEKSLWGQGYGTETIQLLTAYALDEGADAVFGCDIWEYNPASLRAFEKAGYRLDAEIALPPGRKAERCYDLVIKSKHQKKGGARP